MIFGLGDAQFAMIAVAFIAAAGGAVVAAINSAAARRTTEKTREAIGHPEHGTSITSIINDFIAQQVAQDNRLSEHDARLAAQQMQIMGLDRRVTEHDRILRAKEEGSL